MTHARLCCRSHVGVECYRWFHLTCVGCAAVGALAAISLVRTVLRRAAPHSSTHPTHTG